MSGLASLSLTYALVMDIKLDVSICYALLLGALSYGISLVFFIKALEWLGSFRTGMFFSIAPFIGALTSLMLLREWIGCVMFPAIMLTVAGVWLISTEKHEHLHLHQEEVHAHLHNHNDVHHIHEHAGIVREPHIHEHKHLEENHVNSHWPDTHHRHEH